MIAKWFFDVISPFAYLQQEQLDRVADKVKIEFRPVLLAGLLNHWGQLGPAEIDPKKQFTFRHILWQAGRLGIPVRVPRAHPFNPLPLLRLAVLVGNDREKLRLIFHFVWRHGHLPDDEKAFSELIEQVDIPDALERLRDRTVKTQLRNYGQEAIDAGVFGVPTFVVDGYVIWGLDATDMLLDYVRDPQLFATDEMQKAGSIPAAAERKRP